MSIKMNMIFNTQSYSSASPDVEDSPFANSSSFVLYLEPIYNPFMQTYQDIITLNCLPNGSISNMVTRINPPKLSPFKSTYNNNNTEQCIYVLLRYRISKISNVFKQNDAFMGADDIPSVLSYLNSHGYIIDNSMCLNIGGIHNVNLHGNRKMIVMVSSGV